MRCPLAGIRHARNVFVAAQFAVYVNYTFTYAKHIAKCENTKCKTDFTWTDWKRLHASLVLKEWIAITEELRLLYLGFSAPLKNAPSASCLNKKVQCYRYYQAIKQGNVQEKVILNYHSILLYTE